MRGRQVFELSDFESEKASGDEEAEGAAASSVDGAFSTSRTLGAIVADEGSRAVPAGPEAKAVGRRRQERAAAPNVDTKFMTALSLTEGFRCGGAHGKNLTPREIQVLRLVVSGAINKEIAERLSISFNTVLTHRKNISAKTGIKTVSGLTFYALLNGYVSPAEIGMP